MYGCKRRSITTPTLHPRPTPQPAIRNQRSFSLELMSPFYSCRSSQDDIFYSSDFHLVRFFFFPRPRPRTMSSAVSPVWPARRSISNFHLAVTGLSSSIHLHRRQISHTCFSRDENRAARIRYLLLILIRNRILSQPDTTRLKIKKR